MTHTKVNEEVFSEYDCTFKDCSHDECPTKRVDICEECSCKAWEEHEGGVVTWMECLDNLALDEFDVEIESRTMIVRFVASNGVEISGGASLFIKDSRARNSEARMMTIQHRKTQALREYFAQERME